MGSHQKPCTHKFTYVFRYDTALYLILFARNDRNCHKISVYNYPLGHNTYNSYNGVGQIEFNPESLQIIPRPEKL